jgi:SHS2 domain-containing protein
MPYRYLEDVAVADAAFEAWGDSVEEMFKAASDATMNVMVENLATIRAQEHRRFRIEDSQIDMLLFQWLQELVYRKDAEQLLLLVHSSRIEQLGNNWMVHIEAEGEKIDPSRHDLIVDIKAITLYRFSVQQTGHGWMASVMVDV